MPIIFGHICAIALVFLPKKSATKSQEFQTPDDEKSSQGKRATLLATRCRLALRVPFVTSIASGMQ